MNYIKKLLKRKLVLAGIGIVVVVGGYYGYKAVTTKGTTTSYVTSPLAKGTITSSVSGTGQVSNSNQIDIKPQATGTVTSVSAVQGQKVDSGAVIAQIDPKDATKAVKTAQINLETAQLALEKVKNSADNLSLVQAENALTSAQNTLAKLKLSQGTNYDDAQQAKEKAQDNLTKGYEDAFNNVSDTFLDLPTVIARLQAILYSNEIGVSETSVGRDRSNSDALLDSIPSADKYKIQAFQTSAQNDYAKARTAYDATFTAYKNASRYSNNDTIQTLLAQTLDTTKTISQAAKSESNYLDAWSDYRTQHSQNVYAKVTEYQSNLSTYIGQTNSHISSLLSTQTTLKNNTDAINNANRDLSGMDSNNPLDITAAEAAVTEKQAALDKLEAGPDALDLRNAELTLRQRQVDLSDAQSKLADYTIKAPISGVLASVSIKKGDQANASTAAATIITDQQIAEITLNEVDVAKVKVGQKANVTFSAIDGLSISGQVAEVDLIGTVTQNVVSFKTKIALDTQDDRVKPNMSASADIITDIKQDVLIAPSSAVKTSDNGNYVEILVNGAPVQHEVITGLSNDTDTELSGDIKEGDEVITQTIVNSGTTAKASTGQSGSILRSLGGGGGGRTGAAGGGPPGQ